MDASFELHVAPARGPAFDWPLSAPSAVVGRSRSCDLVLDDRLLSRRHARFYQQEGGVWVEDLGSRNGTLLNRKALEGPVRILPGDVVQLGETAITVRGPASDVTTGAIAGPLTVLRSASDLLLRAKEGTDPARGDEATLRHAAERMRLLNDVHQALARPIELEALLDLILDRAFEHLGPEEGVVFLRRPDGTLASAASRGVPESRGGMAESRTLLDEVGERGHSALALDVLADVRFAAAASLAGTGVRSLVAAPFLGDDRPLGFIVLSSRAHVRQFSEEDLELLTSLASVAAMRIRNVALAEEARERRRLEQELALARRVQLGLLPASLPQVPGYELHGANFPSRGVSGDFFDVKARGGDECVLVLVDVSGKGMAAALLAASLEALAADPIEDGLPPEEICSRVSRRLLGRTAAERYATAVVAALEGASGRALLSNAGHGPVLLVRAMGEIERLGSTGPPLGLIPDSRYSSHEVRLAPGDTLVLYTDGIVEAEDPAGEEYGVDRLVEACRRHRGSSPRDLAERISEDLEAFARGTPFADDRTLLLARRVGP